MAFFWRIFAGMMAAGEEAKMIYKSSKLEKTCCSIGLRRGVPLCAESQTRRYNAALPVSPRLCPILE